MEENNNIDISDNNLENRPNSKNLKIFIIGGIVLVVLIIVAVVVLAVANRKQTEEFSVEEVIKESGYSEFLGKADSKNETEVLTKLENKIAEDNECRYGYWEEFETKSKETVDIFYQDSFFKEYNQDVSSLVNTTVSAFFSSVYPEYSSLGYVGATLNGDKFFIVSNTGDVYRAEILTSKEGYKGVSIKNRDGLEILNYSGRLNANDSDESNSSEPLNPIDEENLDEELEEELEKPENEQ